MSRPAGVRVRRHGGGSSAIARCTLLTGGSNIVYTNLDPEELVHECNARARGSCAARLTVSPVLYERVKLTVYRIIWCAASPAQLRRASRSVPGYTAVDA